MENHVHSLYSSQMRCSRKSRKLPVRSVLEGTPYFAQWSWNPFPGEGVRLHGGRLNRPGTPAPYTAPSPLAAQRETERLGRPTQTLVPCTHEVDAEPVFDARNGTSRDATSAVSVVHACPAREAAMHAGAGSASWALADGRVNRVILKCQTEASRLGPGPMISIS